MNPALEIVEFTDPACSWAWGSEPKLRLLRWSYQDRVAWRRVLGGLVARPADPMFDPTSLPTAEYFATTAATTGMPYPALLNHPPTSSVEACLAVKAAERHSDALASRLLRRLREACFVFGHPPDTLDRVLAVAAGVAGLDIDRLAHDIATPKTQAAFGSDWEETRNPNHDVRSLRGRHPGAGTPRQEDGRWRYVFPTLIIRGIRGERTIAGWNPYEHYLDAMEAVSPGSTADPRPLPDVHTAFERWPLLADTELKTLCGVGPAPAPPGSIPFEPGGGRVWMTPHEAASWKTLADDRAPSAMPS